MGLIQNLTYPLPRETILLNSETLDMQQAISDIARFLLSCKEQSLRSFMSKHGLLPKQVELVVHAQDPYRWDVRKKNGSIVESFGLDFNLNNCSNLFLHSFHLAALSEERIFIYRAQAMKRCPHCGCQVEQDQDFCPECGIQLRFDFESKRQGLRAG